MYRISIQNQNSNDHSQNTKTPKNLALMAKSSKIFWVFVILSNPLFIFSQVDEFYYGFSRENINISLNGVAEIEKKGILRLTDDTNNVIGRAFYPSRLKFKNSTNGSAFSFSTSFAFAIVPNSVAQVGHGFAFTISPTKELKGGLPAQYLGLLNTSNIRRFSNHVFAVEFDTVRDLEFQDKNGNHVGIDINDLESNASASAAYFSDNSTKLEFSLTSGKTIQAWIEYDSVTNLLNVTLSPSSSKPNLPILSYKVDISPIVLDYMYVGFSASTGLLSSSHYILGWSFKINGVGRTLDLDSLPSLTGPKKNHRVLSIWISVSASIFMITVIFAAIYYNIRIKKADVVEKWELNVGPHRFSYQELKLATKGFRDKELVGFGGFGRVYKGTLPNSKTQIAVKRISPESKQGLREFASEIASIGRLRHRNLVQLQGWCRRRGDLLLVYDFMPNGSLDKFLFDEPKSILSWNQRLKIIKGVASGLLYLHEEWEQIVIHRDVKASNVLLDNELNGRLGDFGLAKLYEHGSNPNTTRVVGTLGYLAPELTRTGKPNTSSDVYAFGALLLEVTCGRRPVEPKALPEEMILVDWVGNACKDGMILDVVDPRLKGEFDEGEVVMVLKMGLMCSNNAPNARPSMRQVVSYLEGVKLPEVLNQEEEVHDFVHLYSSSLENVCLNSSTEIEDGEVKAPPTSSLSILIA